MFKRRKAAAAPTTPGETTPGATDSADSSDSVESVGETRPIQRIRGEEERPAGEPAEEARAEQTTQAERAEQAEHTQPIQATPVASAPEETNEAVETVEEKSEAPESESAESPSSQPDSVREPFDPDPEEAEVEDGGTEAPLAAYAAADVRPHPDHPEKPDGPTDLKKPSVFSAVKRSFREFGDDQCTDLAAGLTYYSVLSIFPAALALLSILGLVGNPDRFVTAILNVVGKISPDAARNIKTPLNDLVNSGGAGIALAVGVVLALYSASGYVGAFGRAMNRIYEVDEGRPIWKLKPIQFLITLATVVLCAAALVILVVSGSVAQAVGDEIGLGDTAVEVWNYAKWPVLLIIVIMVVALLYYATPNVRQPSFRWISVGAFVAILVWLVSSVGFAFYVANFGSYNKTYGSIAGAVVALLWLWLTNLALLYGAELDSELERSRELQAGMPAEETLQLPLRDDRGVVKAQAKREKAVAANRQLRQDFMHEHGDINDRPF